MFHQAQTNFVKSLQQKHDNYIRAIMHRLKEIRTTEGIAAAYLRVSLHELEGDPQLSAQYFELLKVYVVEDRWHQIKAN